ncbi:MAG: hypothetical protein ACI9E1_002394, partial [Cryomorphaceae bacterium]
MISIEKYRVDSLVTICLDESAFLGAFMVDDSAAEG